MKRLFIGLVVIEAIFVLLNISFDGWTYLENVISNFPQPKFIEEIKQIAINFKLMDGSNILEVIKLLFQSLLSIVKIPVLFVVYVFEIIAVLFKGVVLCIG